LTHQITFNCGESAAILLKNTWATSGNQTEDFFLSQVWIDYYFSKWPENDHYGLISHNNSAIAQLSAGTFSSRLHFRYTSLGLNVSSNVGLRNATLETNGAIGNDATTLLNTFPAILDLLLAKADWDELRVDALLEEEANEIIAVASAKGLSHYVESENKTYLVDLEKIRNEFAGNFLASRSSNTRAQLRKAQRKAEQELGKLKLSVAQSSLEATGWLKELSILHQVRWNQFGKFDGFANPTFSEFQHGLVQTCFDNSTLQMFRLDAGGTTLAYLYNFIYKGKVLFYMSGVNYKDTDQYKPGLLAHWLAIEYNLAAGAKTYDFLAGTNRYKESLSTHSANRVCLRLRRPKFFFTIEHWLRQVKRAKNKQNQ
jgi:Acetyltransferase (GNAT) domain